MTTEQKDIIITDTIDGIGAREYENYLGHALCLDGECTFEWCGQKMAMHAGDLLIVRRGKLMEHIEPDAAFRVKMIYVSAPFITLSTPQSNYGMKGQLALFLNPIMHLTPVMFAQCLRNFDNLQGRILETSHHFYRELMVNAVQTMILDFFDFHSRLYGEQDVSSQNAAIMNGFIRLLELGEYRRHREVTWYADQLCVTSKYLSEVSKKTSGYAANFWINRYTTLDISRLLRDKRLTFVQISDIFGFSSPAYFSRYVAHNLGMNPTEYRE